MFPEFVAFLEATSELIKPSSSFYERLLEHLPKFQHTPEIQQKPQKHSESESNPIVRDPGAAIHGLPPLSRARAASVVDGQRSVEAASEAASTKVSQDARVNAKLDRGNRIPESRHSSWGNDDDDNDEPVLVRVPLKRPISRRASRPGSASNVFEIARRQLMAMTPEFSDSDVELPIRSVAPSASLSLAALPRPEIVRGGPEPIPVPLPPPPAFSDRREPREDVRQRRGALSTVPEEAGVELADAEVAVAMHSPIAVPSALVNHSAVNQRHQQRQQLLKSSSPVAVVKPLPPKTRGTETESPLTYLASSHPRRSTSTSCPPPTGSSTPSSTAPISAPRTRSLSLFPSSSAAQSTTSHVGPSLTSVHSVSPDYSSTPPPTPLMAPREQRFPAANHADSHSCGASPTQQRRSSPVASTESAASSHADRIPSTSVVSASDCPSTAVATLTSTALQSFLTSTTAVDAARVAAASDMPDRMQFLESRIGQLERALLNSPCGCSLMTR